jgi:predicted Zn finger-like uncharacterized protein
MTIVRASVAYGNLIREGGAVMIEVQCTSCHTRYRIDEQVLPEGTPTFKCSRCGHVFSFDPREFKAPEQPAATPPRTSPPEPPPPPSARSTPPTPAAAASPPPLPEPERPGGPDAPTAASAPAPEPQGPDAPATAHKPTEEFFNRTFGDDTQDAPSGENLAFDFNDEAHDTQQDSPRPDEPPRYDDGWEVGEPDEEPAAPRAARPKTRSTPREIEMTRRRDRPGPIPDPVADEYIMDDEAAPVYNRGVTRSSRFFLVLFLLVALGYGTLTVFIRSAPAAAADILSRLPLIGERFVLPITPARLVALRDVHTQYLRTRGGYNALVITGIAENVSESPLHAIQIAAALRDPAARSLGGQAVYCGNNLSLKTVTQMTPHEIEFFEKLDPPKTFRLDPAATSPFAIVFVNPPANVKQFDISVAKATTAPDQSPEPANG